jgi:phenylacetate-coenzyme A ligase PaaK-like adenylate-forming protein
MPVIQSNKANPRFGPAASVAPARATTFQPAIRRKRPSRLFPFVRYELGGEIELAPASDPVAVAAFARVLGRCNDDVMLSDGQRVHPEAFTQALREVSALFA